MTNQKIYEKVAEHIKTQILKGDIKPGEKLPSAKELCERYQVSRSTVREALSALQVIGLIETRQGEGSTVRTVNPEDFKLPNFQQVLLTKETLLELLEARNLLEVSIAGLAAINRTESDLEKLVLILESMEEHLHDEQQSRLLDMQFHLAIATSSQNSILLRMLESISEPMEKSMKDIRKVSFNKEFSDSVLAGHQNVYFAIAEGNAELAEQMMKDHLNHFFIWMKEYYKR